MTKNLEHIFHCKTQSAQKAMIRLVTGYILQIPLIAIDNLQGS